MKLARLVILALLLPLGCLPADPTSLKEPPEPSKGPAPEETLASGRARLDAVIKHVRQRDLRTDNAFWTIFHAILGLGPSVTMLDPAKGERVNALDYITRGGEVRGLAFLPKAHGIDVQLGPQWVGQGHQDQFIAEMAQWKLPADRAFKIHGKEYPFLDFIRYAQKRASVKGSQELSWAVLVIAEYLGPDATWVNEAGDTLRIEDLVSYEIAQPMDERAACGGTHRLFGISWVLQLHLKKGGAREGVWRQAEDFLERHKVLAKSYQNADGSFSTNFFRDRGAAKDLQLRMNTTGHTLEWLALTLSDSELKQDWVTRAVDALTQMFLEIRDTGMESGSLYHAIHGLLIYYARIHGPEALGELAPHLPLKRGQAPF